MLQLLVNQLVGDLLGFIVGVLGWTGLSFFGLELPAFCSTVCHGLGAACGAFVGSQDDSVARWSAGTAAGVGAMGLALGFAVPLSLWPDSAHGPLLGIFVTGPLGVVLGALLGLVIGIAREARRPAYSTDLSPREVRTTAAIESTSNTRESAALARVLVIVSAPSAYAGIRVVVLLIAGRSPGICFSPAQDPPGGEGRHPPTERKARHPPTECGDPHALVQMSPPGELRSGIGHPRWFAPSEPFCCRTLTP